VSVGVFGESRDPGSGTIGNPLEVTENLETVPTLVLSGGVSVKPHLGIEVSVDLAPSQDFP
jgi:hypothetical protein